MAAPAGIMGWLIRSLQLNKEWIRERAHKTREFIKADIFECIDGLSNTTQHHSLTGDVSQEARARAPA